jgi:nuclease S1
MIRSSVRHGLLAFILISSLLPTQQLFAWGDQGHEIIAVIAYARLTPAVKNKVDALLAADRDTLTAADFVSRSTWADKFRDSDRSTTKIRYGATRNWHFVDIEIADGNTDSACRHHPKLARGVLASAGPADDCLIDKIDQFFAELRNTNIAKTERILALKFLLHLIGDLHQPLHAADNKDRGGNAIPVISENDTRIDNLHSYWDNHLVQRLGNDSRAVGAALNRQINSANPDTWSKGTVNDWARQSFTRAKQVAYDFTGLQRFIDDHGLKGVRINTAYDNRALPVIREQLSKAGVRLGSILNGALK